MKTLIVSGAGQRDQGTRSLMELKMNMFGYLVVNLIPTYPQTSLQHTETTVTRFKRFEVRVRKQEEPILWLKITVDNIAATYLDKLA